uniref:Secreted SPRY domain-containing protein 9 n=1 Tax=Globodera rostochiensis TaxID=31243 RepID=I7AV00_GLORO|nr:secreted SPRY domain-containing protein 9 [Globodera rostochiensis]
MPTFLFLAAIFLLVAASTLLETDASPPPKTNAKLENEPSTGNAEPKAEQNRWDSAACHEGLTLSPDKLIVEFAGENSGWRSVRAKQQLISKDGIFYYEVKISGNVNGIYIGLATEQMPLDTWVGRDKGSYAYSNSGSFWGHKQRPFIEGNPKFDPNDIIGCGFHLKSRQIIYTKNDKLLGTAYLLVDSAAKLYPCVSMFNPGTKIEANFGLKKFKFDIAKAFRK